MTLTTTILVLTALTLVVYDILAVFVHGKDATISVTLYTLARRYPIIPFALGLLMGHLFWAL